MNIIVRFLLNGLAVFLTDYLLSGVHIENYGYAILVAIVLSLVNAIVKPVLIIFTIPITFVTMGLFLLVINAMMIQLTDWFIDGFTVEGFWWALAFSIILWLFNSMFGDLTKEKKKQQ